MMPAHASPAQGSDEMAKLMMSLNVVTAPIVLRTTSRTTIVFPPIEKDRRASGSFSRVLWARLWICFSFSGPSVASPAPDEVVFAPMRAATVRSARI